MKFLKRWHYIPVFAILILLAIGRVKLYGNPYLSVPTRDTDSFVSSSEVPILSWEAMTGRRLFTTNLLYKAFTPTGGYPKLEPNVDTTWRNVYPGFEKIALFQSIVSVLGWEILALAMVSKIKNVYLKILSAILILLFGFSPHVADWDSVLGSESLSFSLFALALGLLIWLVFDVYEQKQNSPKTIVLAIMWFIVFFLWTFVRDANLYAMFATCLMLIVTIIAFRQYRRSWVSIILGVMLVASFGLGLASSMQSARSNIQVEHVIFEFVLPYPARADFMHKLGMPSTDSPSFKEWFDKNAPRSYMLFLITHPGFTLTHYLIGAYVAFDPYLQAYFRATDLQWRTQLVAMGGELHLGITALVIATILLSVLWIFTITDTDKRQKKASKPWTWLATWIFLTGNFTLFVSIFGDTVALHRHAIFSTTELRLMMWSLIMVLSDLLLSKNNQESA